jgi:hypothetical protein
MNNDLYGEINEGIGTGILVTTFIFALATKLLGRMRWQPNCWVENQKARKKLKKQ